MAGERKRERSDIDTGVDKGLPPITAAGDDLEKTNAVGEADDKVNEQKTKPSEEVVKVSDIDQAPKKKPRLIWTRELRKCFQDAVKLLGANKAVPTKILELMNVEHLTRDNVASHLQKFRLQKKKREEEQAKAGAASGNVPKVVYPTMSGIPQQPCVLQNTMQGINKECACLDRSQLARSFANHNLNMIQGFPSNREVYGMPFKDVAVNRMSRVGLVHGLSDSYDPYHINKFVHNYGPSSLKPLVDSYAHNLTDWSYFHDTTRVPQYDRRHELSLADQVIISPSSVPQYDQHNELALAELGVISPSSVPQYDRRNELSVADLDIVSPSFVPQYDRRDELSVVDQGTISPSLAEEGLGVGMPHLPEVGHGGIGVGMPHLPEVGLGGLGLGGIGVGMPHLPEVGHGGIGVRMPHLPLGVRMPHLPEVGLGGLGVHMARLPEATGGIGGAGVGVTHPPEATGLGGLGVVVPHLPEAGFGVGVPRPPNGGLVGVEGLGEIGGGMPRPPNGGLAGMKVEGLGRLGGVGEGVPRPPEVKVEGLGQGMPHQPEATGGLMKVEGFGEGVPIPPEATGWMNDFQQGLDQTFDFDGGIDSALDWSDFSMNMKGDLEDLDGKSIDDLFRR